MTAYARRGYWIALAIAVLFALMTGNAFAGDKKHHYEPPPLPHTNPANTNVNTNVNANTNNTTNYNEARNNANAASNSESNNTNTNVAHGGSVEMGDTIAASGDSSATGGSVSIQSTIPKNTPDVIAPSNYPTVPCFRPASGGAAVAGFGISGGGGSIDKDCTIREQDRSKRETAQAFASIGESDLAHLILCSTSDAIAVFGDKCPVRVPPPPLPAVEPKADTSNFATHDDVAKLKTDVDEKLKRLYKSTVQK